MKTMCVMLFLSILAAAEAEMNWIVFEKITEFGQTLILYCNLHELCKDTAGWVKWLSSSNYETLILSVKETRFDEALKYDGRVGTNGFYLMIRNVSFKDFETNYSCTYGMNTSPMQLLTISDAFVDIKATTETKASMVKTTDDFESQTPVIYILFALVIILVAAVLFLSVCLYRVKRQMGLLNRSQDDPTQPASRYIVVNSTMEETAATEETPMVQRLNNLPNSTNDDDDQLSEDAEINCTELSPKQLHTMTSTKSNDPIENATSFEEMVNSHHARGMPVTCLETDENKQMEYNCVVNSEPAKIEDYLKSGYESLQSDSGISTSSSKFACLVVNSKTNKFRTATVMLNTDQQKNLKEKTVVKT